MRKVKFKDFIPEDGYISFNVALIEMQDGTMREVRVDKVKFID